MHPAPSVIVFTVLSGAGFGFLALLALGAVPVTGMSAFLIWGAAFGLAVIGLLASTFHLGNPQRAWRAFSQWRTSWLSREGCLAVLTLVAAAPLALMAMAGQAPSLVLGAVVALLCALTVGATAMIYAQLRTVPRWNQPMTPVKFLTFALTGGAILTGQGGMAAALCLVLAIVLAVTFHLGDRRFHAVGASLGSATGLDALGVPRVLAPAHTADNYLLREMIHIVGRRHAARLRLIAVLCAGVIPAVLLVVAPATVMVTVLAFAIHLLGACAARWLFFAEAEHVVGLYYGAR